MPIIKTPAELSADELFRHELRTALEHPALQTAISSLQFHRGLMRANSAIVPAANIHHTALWTSGFNGAFDALEHMTKVPVKASENPLPYEHIEPLNN